MQDVRSKVCKGGRRFGFTIVELVIAIVVIAILSTMLYMSYTGVQRRSADSVTQTAVADALKALELYYVFNKEYPSNIADTEYAPPIEIAVSLFTNAPQKPIYQNLTSAQNAQLFLNACNGNMPVVQGGVTYNNSCVYNGNNAHIKGTKGSNVVIHGPQIGQSDFVLTCGPACTGTQQKIIDTFLAQGGTFPVIVPKKGSTLPAPTMQVAGPATEFCVQGVSGAFPDIVYHAVMDSSAPREGPCPANPALHYP